MVDQPGGGYRAATLEHPAQDVSVQRSRPVRRQDGLHGLARQLMAEHDDVALRQDQTRRDTIVDEVWCGRCLIIQQPALDAVGHHRAELEHGARLWREPQGAGEGRVADRHRDAAGRARQQLRDVEGVAASLGVDPLRWPTRALRKTCDRRFR